MQSLQFVSWGSRIYGLGFQFKTDLCTLEATGVFSDRMSGFMCTHMALRPVDSIFAFLHPCWLMNWCPEGV